MYQTKPWIYGKLSVDAGVLAALGSTGSVVDIRPETIETFPLIVYTDENQVDFEFASNKPTMSAQRFKIDIFGKTDGATTVEAIGGAVCSFFNGLFFTCTTNGDVPDPDISIRHRILRFSRELFATDLS